MDDEWWRHALHASGDVTFIKPCNCTKAADSNGNVHCCCGVMVTENRPKGWTKPRLDQALANQTHALLPHTADTPTDKSLNNACVDATDIFLEPLGHNNPVLWRWMAGWMDVLRPRQQQDNPPLSSPSLAHAWTSLWGVTEIISGNLKEFTRQWCSPSHAWATQRPARGEVTQCGKNTDNTQATQQFRPLRFYTHIKNDITKVIKYLYLLQVERKYFLWEYKSDLSYTSRGSKSCLAWFGQF